MRNLLADAFNALDISLENPDDILRSIQFIDSLLSPETARKVLRVLTGKESTLQRDTQNTEPNTIDKLLLMLGKAMNEEAPGCADLIRLIGHPLYNAICDLAEKSLAYAQLPDEQFREAQMILIQDARNPFRETTYNIARQLLTPITIFPRFEDSSPPTQETAPDARHPQPPAM